MITYQTIGKMGRLGNQMFQYATLYALGKKLKHDIGVPYSARSSIDKMDFCLQDCFDLTAKDSTKSFFLQFILNLILIMILIYGIFLMVVI